MVVKARLKETFHDMFLLSKKGLFDDTILVCKGGTKIKINSFLLASVFPSIRNLPSSHFEEQSVILVPDVDHEELDTFLHDLGVQRDPVQIRESITYLLQSDYLDIPVNLNGTADITNHSQETKKEEVEDETDMSFDELDPFDENLKSDYSDEDSNHGMQSEVKEELSDDVSFDVDNDEVSGEERHPECTQSVHRKAYCCRFEGCDVEYESVNSRNSHERCKHKLPNNNKLSREKKQPESIKTVNIKTYYCRYEGCSVEYDNVGSRNTHERKRHKGTNDIRRPEPEKVKITKDLTPKTCHICGKSILWSLEHHMKTHKPKQHCDQCGKWFTVHSFKKHRPCMKEVEEKQVCNICGGVFVALDSHIRNLHSGVQTRTCEICGKILKSESYKAHIKKHSKTEQICPECGKKVRDLPSHIKAMHTSDEQKKFQCQDCGKGFLLRSILEKHVVNVHTKTYPYRCRYAGCDAKYNDKSNQLCHEKKKHGGLFTAAKASNKL